MLELMNILKKSGGVEGIYKLVPSDIAKDDYFGMSVSISGDETLLVVGSYYDDDKGGDSGSVYLFNKTSTDWVFEAKLTTPNSNSNAYFGASVAISKDKSTIAVGAPGENVTRGAIYIFIKNETGWVQQARIAISGAATAERLGGNLSISDDGNVVLAGSSNNINNSINTGAAFIFNRSGTTWSQQAKLLAPSGSDKAYFGGTVSISGNGLVAFIGAYGTSVRAGYIFNKNGTSWSYHSQINSGVGTDVAFARSAKLNTDGSLLLVGAYGTPLDGLNYVGTVHVFNLSGNQYIRRSIIRPNVAYANLWFGATAGIDISEDNSKIVVTSTGSSKPGSLHVFELEDNVWIEKKVLLGIDTNPSGWFGGSFALAPSGNFAVVGVPRGYDTTFTTGVTYIYDLTL